MGEDWIHEIKFDGCRIVATIGTAGPRLVGPDGVDRTAALPTLVRELATLPAATAVIDGELVALTPGGLSDAEALEEALRAGADADLFYYAFDLLHLDGIDWRERPLLERKGRLQALLEPGVESPHVRYSEHVEGGGDAFFRRASELGFEGAVSKKKNAPYRPGSGPDWVSVSCRKVREFMIGGFTESGALLLGIPEGPGLVYAGRVEAGLREELHRQLARLEGPESPFVTLVTLEERRGVHWVEPRLSVVVSYSNWTRDRRLRHPLFVGLREVGRASTPLAGKPE